MKKAKILVLIMSISVFFSGCGVAENESSSSKSNNNHYVFAEGMPSKFVRVSVINTLSEEGKKEKTKDVIYPEVNYDHNSVFVGGKTLR